ncbi:MAG: response regulator transcription factor [Acidobacteria bacterium]|nr:response regulator transcription factor [Acidobacteriota bacterium]
MKEPLKNEHHGTLTSAISAIVVDDEPLAREELAFLLKAHSDVHVVAEARNGLEALQLIKEHEPDMIFVDVAMPGLDGLGLVRKLLEKKGKLKMPHVVFATAYDQYAVQAFELNAIDYLLKPIDKGRLAQSVQRVRRLMETPAPSAPSSTDALEDLLRTLKERAPQQSKLLLRASNRLFLIDAQELIYATIEGGLITLVTKEMEGETNYRTLEDLQANLDPNTFWRVHRSYLVNINHIKEVVPWFKSSYQLRMNDKKNTEIPVSRAQTKRLRELLKL